MIYFLLVYIIFGTLCFGFLIKDSLKYDDLTLFDVLLCIGIGVMWPVVILSEVDKILTYIQKFNFVIWRRK